MVFPSQAELERRLAAFQDSIEAAERQSDARFLAAFHNPPAGIGMHEIDLEHRIRRVNLEELKILGYTERDMVGRPAWEFIVMQEASQRAIQRKFSPDQELKPFLRTFRRSDGAGVPMLLLDRRLVDKRGSGHWLANGNDRDALDALGAPAAPFRPSSGPAACARVPEARNI